MFRPASTERLAAPPVIYDAEVVEMRLCDAAATMRALPGRGTWPAGYRTAWPEMVVTTADALPEYGEDIDIRPPTARQISAMDEAFRWLRFIPDERAGHRRIILLRSLISPTHRRHLLSWRAIGKKMGLNHATVQQRYSAGIADITTELYRQQLKGAAWALDWMAARQVADSLNPKRLVLEEPELPARPARSRDDTRPIVVFSAAEQAVRIAGFVQNMNGRSRAALLHFPADGTPRDLRHARGFGRHEVAVIETVGLLSPCGDGGYCLTAEGITAKGLLGKTSRA